MHIDAATQLLLDARHSGLALDWRRLAVGDAEIAYAVQDAQLQRLGPIGGWKVGSKGDGSLPACAPLPASGVLASGAPLRGPQWRMRGLEVELALRVGRDYHPGDQVPDEAELRTVFDAILPAIEVVETRLGHPPCTNPWAGMADLQSHGALIIGAAQPLPATLSLRQIAASLHIDGQEITRTTGGNPADLWPMLGWLALHCARRGQPWCQRQVITTGSCTGLQLARAGRQIEGALAGIGAVSFSFAN